MKRVAGMLFASWLAMAAHVAGLAPAVAAESAAPVQELGEVRASGWVRGASWSRSPDAYFLNLTLDWAGYAERRIAATPVTGEQAAPVASEPGTAIQSAERSRFFIGNTIADPRGLDLVLPCGRVLTLVERRRPGQPPPLPPTPGKDQAYPPKMKESRIEVWLLKSDGTQLAPSGYSCVSAPASSGGEVQYKFPADSARAVAAAIRVDDEFYIEKLQPLELPQALQ